MNMKIKALIIGCPGNLQDKENYLPGADIDLDNWKKFLSSPVGGGWEGGELDVLRNPSRDSVLNAVSKCENLDYLFLSFSGHGFHHEGQNYIYLGKDALNVTSLTAKAKRQFKVIDACRSLVSSVLTESVVSKFASARLDSAGARKTFLKKLDLCEHGMETVFACSVKETAAENSTNGGFFSFSMMSAAREWAGNSPREEIIDIKKCFFTAKEKVESIQPSQHPSHEFSRRMNWFPFGVNAN